MYMRKFDHRIPLHIGPTGTLRAPLRDFTSKMKQHLKQGGQKLQDTHEHEILSVLAREGFDSSPTRLLSTPSGSPDAPATQAQPSHGVRGAKPSLATRDPEVADFHPPGCDRYRDQFHETQEGSRTPQRDCSGAGLPEPTRAGAASPGRSDGGKADDQQELFQCGEHGRNQFPSEPTETTSWPRKDQRELSGCAQDVPTKMQLLPGLRDAHSSRSQCSGRELSTCPDHQSGIQQLDEPDQVPRLQQDDRTNHQEDDWQQDRNTGYRATALPAVPRVPEVSEDSEAVKNQSEWINSNEVDVGPALAKDQILFSSKEYKSCSFAQDR